MKQYILLFVLFSLPLIINAQCNADNVKIPTSVAPHNTSEKPKTLIVEAMGVKELKLTIYDRKGQKIFESTSSILGASNDVVKNIDTEWDGMVAGSEMDAGIYFYSIEAECLDKTIVRKSGTVVLTIDKE